MASAAIRVAWPVPHGFSLLGFRVKPSGRLSSSCSTSSTSILFLYLDTTLASKSALKSLLHRILYRQSDDQVKS